MSACAPSSPMPRPDVDVHEFYPGTGSGGGTARETSSAASTRGHVRLSRLQTRATTRSRRACAIWPTSYRRRRSAPPRLRPDRPQPGRRTRTLGLGSRCRRDREPVVRLARALRCSPTPSPVPAPSCSPARRRPGSTRGTGRGGRCRHLRDADVDLVRARGALDERACDASSASARRCSPISPTRRPDELCLSMSPLLLSGSDQDQPAPCGH